MTSKLIAFRLYLIFISSVSSEIFFLFPWWSLSHFRAGLSLLLTVSPYPAQNLALQGAQTMFVEPKFILPDRDVTAG